MNNVELPEGWQASQIIDSQSTHGEPTQPSDPSKIALHGLLNEDNEYRIYTIPANTPIAKIIEFFSVGSHGAVNNGYSIKETVSKVANTASALACIFPVRCTFADGAGLKLRFLREITDSEINQIEKLFSEGDEIQLGLERYISEWDGQSALLQPIKEEGLIQLWWD